MRNWIACSSFSSLFLSLSILLFCSPVDSYSQLSDNNFSTDFSEPAAFNASDNRYNFLNPDTTRQDPNPNLPDPKSVMFKSMMLPGWGQVINNQTWKVPIVYAILGGLGYYSVYLTKRYHDYRAAYYNLNPRPPDNEPPTDRPFGPTPSYISPNANLQQLRSLRNTYRNRRDLVYVGIVVAYGLNIVDAYVFAHMRSFDVSEDLSMRPSIKPTIMADRSPGITLSLDLIKK